MGSVRIAALAAVAVLASGASASRAADYPPPPYQNSPQPYPAMPPQYQQQPQYQPGPQYQVPPQAQFVPQGPCGPNQPYGPGGPGQPCLPVTPPPPPPPPPVIPPAPPVHYHHQHQYQYQHYHNQHVSVEAWGGWYIRGDIGMTNQAVTSLDNALFANAPGLQIIDKNFEAGMLFGFGVGHKWNNWLRFDLTAEYRGETGFHGMDVYSCGTPSGACFNNYTGKKSEWLFLANAYADLGTWYGVTPFVGVGIGFARIGIHSFRDAGIDDFNSPTLATAESGYKWNVAYAFHAGLSYEVTRNVSLEFAYRYVYLGTGETGDLIAYDGTNNIRNPMIFRGIDSHDLKFGVRYLFATGAQTFAMPPVQQVFQPLMRRF